MIVQLYFLAFFKRSP